MKDCQQITEDIEKGKVTSLTVSERVAIRLHLAVCKGCRTYRKDSQILDRLLRNQHRINYHFTSEEKTRLKRRLE